MSPQTPRGRSVPPSKRTKGRPNAGPAPTTHVEPAKTPPPASGKAAPAVPAGNVGDQAKAAAPTPAKSTPVAESHAQPAGKRAKGVATKRKKHGTAYRWVVAYLPLMIGMFVVLGAVWVWASFINQPTSAQRWTAIENKWSPPREQARVAVNSAVVAVPFDLAKEQAAYKDFATQTKGWLDAATAVSDWGPAKDAVDKFKTDAKLLLDQLDGIAAAKSQQELANDYYTTLGVTDRTVTADIRAVEIALGLVSSDPAASVPPLPGALGAPTPFPSPSGSGSPAATPSATPAITPTPTPTPTPTLTPAPSAT